MMVEPQIVQSTLDEVRTAIPDAVRLARVVCLATRIEPELLRYARLELLPDVNAGAEADLWFSPLVESYSSIALVLMPEIAALLRDELAQDQQLLDAVWHIVHELHATAPPAIRLEEEVTYLSLSMRPDARINLEHRLFSTLQAIVEEDRSGLIQWAARALPRLPEKVHQSEAAWMLAIVASTALGGRQILQGEAPPHAVEEWLPHILPPDAPRVIISVRLIEGGIEVSTDIFDEGHTIEIPRTNPLLLGIARMEDGHERIQQVVLTQGQTQLVEVNGDTVIIQTALGERYRVQAKSTGPRRTRYVDPRSDASTTKLSSNAEQIEEPKAVSQDQHNRLVMLNKVRQIWITGLLDRSIAQDARIALGLESRPDAVIDPVDLIVQRPSRAPEPLPDGIAISTVYDQFGGALLILGAPGSGKTTLLLELTRDLLDRAEDDPTHPIPVVLPLSSWAAGRNPLAAWLVDELVLRYEVSRKLAEAWLDADAILPLLDGLDEVVPAHRAACVSTINAFRQTHGYLPLVVTSRTGDYQVLSPHVQLHGAIVVQPLSRDQVRAYLRAVGVTAIPRSDSPLWELFDTPLMLTIAALAYAGQPLDSLATADPITARDRLFDAYVERMFQGNSRNAPYARPQVMRWLAWLAQEMTAQNLEIFKPGTLGMVRRFSLTRSGDLPWNNRAFLDYATQRIILRRVGDGYMFIHRLLQDYFAAMDIK